MEGGSNIAFKLFLLFSLAAPSRRPLLRLRLRRLLLLLLPHDVRIPLLPLLQRQPRVGVGRPRALLLVLLLLLQVLLPRELPLVAPSHRGRPSFLGEEADRQDEQEEKMEEEEEEEDKELKIAVAVLREPAQTKNIKKT